MPVYVDKARNKFRRMIMCHMLADTPEELHAMAKKLSLQTRWFQHAGTPHYDLALNKRKQALLLGAVEIERREVVELIRRIQKTNLMAWSVKENVQTK